MELCFERMTECRLLNLQGIILHTSSGREVLKAGVYGMSRAVFTDYQEVVIGHDSR